MHDMSRQNTHHSGCVLYWDFNEIISKVMTKRSYSRDCFSTLCKLFISSLCCFSALGMICKSKASPDTFIDLRPLIQELPIEEEKTSEKIISCFTYCRR